MTGHPAGPGPAGPSSPPLPPDLGAGQLVEVAPGVRRLVAPNPGLMTGPGTNTYLVGADHVALIDPGPADDAHESAILEAAGDRLESVLVTHTHVDHSPLAARLKAATGARVLGYGPAPANQPPGLDAHDLEFRPDQRLADGDALSTPEYRLAAVHTPGHAANHLCFDLDGLLFSGDHVMSGSTVVICPPDGDMAEYLESVRRVRARVPRRIAPGHGAMIGNPAAVLDEYLAHRAQREGQVRAALADAGPAGATPESLVARIYLDVAPALHPVARYSVWAHLRMLASQGLAIPAAIEDLDAPWWDPSTAPASTGAPHAAGPAPSASPPGDPGDHAGESA